MVRNRNNVHFQNILVGYDGSKESEKALEAALAIADTLDAKVAVLAVAQPPEPAKAIKLQVLADGAREHFEKSLRRISHAAEQNGIQVETRIAIGHPAEQIIRRAEQSHADLIVVGRRGNSTFEKVVMGSVSEHVLRHAPCPVLVTT
jgi:nucleotide-binding universal stress UspA family protein